LSPLGIDRRPGDLWFSGLSRRPVIYNWFDVGRKGGDRIEQQASVAERIDTQLLEVITRELQQNALVDLVIPEGLLVALQPKPLQPIPNVHHDRPDPLV